LVWMSYRKMRVFSQLVLMKFFSAQNNQSYQTHWKKIRNAFTSDKMLAAYHSLALLTAQVNKAEVKWNSKIKLT